MQEELRGLVAVPAALSYCYALPSFIRPGKLRLLAVLPVVVIFFLLPFSFSSILLRLISSGFLSWLAVFKILLFAFDCGPLCDSSARTRLPFPGFIAVASLPIMIKRESQGKPGPRTLSIVGVATKVFLMALITSAYPHRLRLHRALFLALYSLYLYLMVDMVYVIAAAVGRAMLPAGTVLEPPFAAPYLSSSLQDFWGRRWNLVVSQILRSAVYLPIRAIYGTAAAMLASFFISGLMHEIIWAYLTLERPTGEVTSFFILHGFCTAAEVAAKRWWTRRGMSEASHALTAPLTVGFLIVTSRWLFMEQIARSGAEEQLVNEVEAFFLPLKRGCSLQRV